MGAEAGGSRSSSCVRGHQRRRAPSSTCTRQHQTTKQRATSPTPLPHLHLVGRRPSIVQPATAGAHVVDAFHRVNLRQGWRKENTTHKGFEWGQPHLCLCQWCSTPSGQQRHGRQLLAAVRHQPASPAPVQHLGVATSTWAQLSPPLTLAMPHRSGCMGRACSSRGTAAEAMPRKHWTS